MSEVSPAFVHSGNDGHKRTELHKPLRLLLAVGIAEVIIGMLIDLLGHGLGPVLSFTVHNGHQPVTYTLPMAWLPLATIMVSAGWGFLFAGVLHGRPWMRVAAAILWAGGVPGVGLHYPAVLAGAAIPLVLLAWRGWAGKREVFGVREFLVLGAASLVFYVALLYSTLMALMSGNANAWVQYAVVLIDQFIGLMVVALPVLLLTGQELGEFAEILGKSILSPLDRLKSDYLALVMLGLTVIGLLYVVVTWQTPFQPGDALTVAAVVCLAWLAHKLPRRHYLTEPPVVVLAVPAILAVATLITGIILGSHAQAWLGLSTGAVLGGVVLLILRTRLNRRWPGAAEGTILVSVWTAWFFLTNVGLSSWVVSMRGVEIAVAAGSVALAFFALRGDSQEMRKSLLAALEIILALFVLVAIFEALAHADIDLVSLYADGMGLFVIGSAVYAWLARNRRYRAAGIAIAIAVLLAGLGYSLKIPGGILMLLRQLQFLLVAAALLAKTPHAEHKFGGAFGERAPTGSATFVYIGYVILLVAVLGLFQSADPPIAELGDVHFALLGGLLILYLPLFLLGKLGHIHWTAAAPLPAGEEEADDED
ncbi:MAG: hypothetical protein M0Z41_14205 [Peptococcaceae bacterium]|jgi:hypothetical protein|nr:hypothetical protein [Peptococcaceae bacterium]